MRIPIIDKLIDKQFQSKPEKTSFIATFPLTIKKGEKSGTVDIPCTMNIGNFKLTFPSGVTYIYGDDEKEEESKKARFRSCPAITIALPEISDKDTTIPLQIGLTKNPKYLKSKIEQILIPIFLVLMSAYMILQNAILSVWTLVFLTLLSASIFVALIEFRRVQRELSFWKTVDIKEKVEVEA